MKAELNKFPFLTFSNFSGTSPTVGDTGSSRLFLRNGTVLAFVTSTGTVTDLANLADITAARARANHTGQQESTTISDFSPAVKAVINNALIAGTNVTKTVDGSGNITLSATGGTVGGTDLEGVRDMLNNTLVAGAKMSIVHDDVADTITFTTMATVNATDAELRDRATHTGTQSVSTITDLQSLLDNKSDISHSHAFDPQFDASAIVSGTFAYDRLAPWTPVYYIKSLRGNVWPTNRPTNRTDLPVIYVGDTDPGTALMIDDLDQFFFVGTT